MPKRIGKYEAEFVIANYLTMNKKDIARKLGLGLSSVKKIMNENGLEIPAELKAARKAAGIRGRFAAEHKKAQPGDKFLKANYLIMPVKAMGDKIGKSFCYVNRRLHELGLVIPDEIVERNKQVGRIKPGNVSHNKGKKLASYMNPAAIEASKATRFKKGQIPHNTKEDGAISIRKDTASEIRYKYVRISKGKWELLHRINWEKKNGPIPEGYIVVFKDGDQLNCEPDNLELITNAEHMRRNRASANLTDGYVINTIAGEHRSDVEFKKAIAGMPDIVELKRQVILAKRTIKKHKDEKQQSN